MEKKNCYIFREEISKASGSLWLMHSDMYSMLRSEIIYCNIDMYRLSNQYQAVCIIYYISHCVNKNAQIFFCVGP